MSKDYTSVRHFFSASASTLRRAYTGHTFACTAYTKVVKVLKIPHLTLYKRRPNGQWYGKHNDVLHIQTVAK